MGIKKKLSNKILLNETDFLALHLLNKWTKQWAKIGNVSMK